MVDMPYNKTKQNHLYIIHVYKEDLAINILQWLICHKTQPNQAKPNQTKPNQIWKKNYFKTLKRKMTV